MSRIYLISIVIFAIVFALGKLSYVQCMNVVKVNKKLGVGLNEQEKISLISDPEKVSSGIIQVVDRKPDNMPLSSGVVEIVKKTEAPVENGLLKVGVLQEISVNEEENKNNLHVHAATGEKFDRYEEVPTATPESKLNNQTQSPAETTSQNNQMAVTAYMNNESTSSEMKSTTTTKASNEVPIDSKETTTKINDSIVPSPQNMEINKMNISSSQANINRNDTETNMKSNTDHITTTHSTDDAKSTQETVDKLTQTQATVTSNVPMVTIDSNIEKNGGRRLREALNTDQTTIVNSISSVPETSTSTSKTLSMNNVDMKQSQSTVEQQITFETMTTTQSHMNDFTMSHIVPPASSNSQNMNPPMMQASPTQSSTIKSTTSTTQPNQKRDSGVAQVTSSISIFVSSFLLLFVLI